MTRIGLRRIGVLLVALLCSSFAEAEAQGGLHVLLTHPGGLDAPGVDVMAGALVDAGHRVSIVVPSEGGAGSSLSWTTEGTLPVERGTHPASEDVWSVSGTPSDAVAFALVYPLRDTPPDIVVSGPAFGPSVGANTLQSGAVGAALTAARSGVPAIALSIGIVPREAERTPAYPSTSEAAPGAASLLVEIVRQLAESSAEGLLPPRAVLNVNYPAVGSDAARGVRFAIVSSQRAFRQLFSVNADGTATRVQSVEADPAGAEEGSDVALLAEGFATISLIGGSLDRGRDAWEPLLRRLVIERAP